MSQEFETLQKTLRSRKLKLTKTRLAVFREITASPNSHANAYEIHERLRRKGSRVSLATIYRTLNLLVKTGFVSQIDLGESHSHYEPDIIKTSHGHLICLSCGKIREFSQDKIRPEIAEVADKKDFEPGKFSIQIFGVCRKCKGS